MRVKKKYCCFIKVKYHIEWVKMRPIKITIEQSLFLNCLTGIVAWHVSWLIHLRGSGCQCGCSVIYTTPTYMPELIYPCGPGAQIAGGPENVCVYVCVHVCVCVCLCL